jgi:hypothetical protein
MQFPTMAHSLRPRGSFLLQLFKLVQHDVDLRRRGSLFGALSRSRFASTENSSEIVEVWAILPCPQLNLSRFFGFIHLLRRIYL